MRSKTKNILFLFFAFAAQFLLQVLAALAVVMPATLVKQMQIASMGLHGTVEGTQMLDAFTTGLTGVTVLATHIFLLVCFAIWYIFGCCRKVSFRGSAEALKQKFYGKNVLIIVVLAVSVCFLTNFLMPLASQIIPEQIMQSYLELMEEAGFGESVLPTIAAILVAPFGEELIFRGVIYHYAKGIVANTSNRKYAFYIANTIQALSFGIFHGNLVQGTYAFVIGLLFGYLKERFGSIWACILAHMLVNSVSSFLWEPVVTSLPESNLTYVIASAICLTIVVVAMKKGGPAVSQEDVSEKITVIE